MPNRFQIFGLLSALTAFGCVCATAQTPRFADYPNLEVLRGKPGPKPVFDGKGVLDEKLNESLTAWGKDPPQFGGHYYLFGAHIAQSSWMLGVADLKTGKTGFLEHVTAPDDMDYGSHDKQEFRADSRLLIIRGCINNACGTHYYVFDDVNGRRVRFEAQGKQEPGDGAPAATAEPDFMRRPLTPAELEGKSDDELDLMVNEIFARHGRMFTAKKYQDYFNRQAWYKPKYSPGQFPESSLTAVQKANAELIRSFQAARRQR